MPERVAGVGAWDGNHERARGLAVCYDDSRGVRVPVPLERDRVTTAVAGIEFDKHASRVRFLVGGRARVMPWVRQRGSTSSAPGALTGPSSSERRLTAGRRSRT